MIAVSLFDGISCGQEAFQRASIEIEQYFSSEIDKSAISVTQTNFKNTIQLGDVRGLTKQNLPKADILIGGSPCQGFSSSGKMLNFNDERSKLFFDYVRILEIIKPKYFFLENVVMKQEYQDVITRYLGASPIKINSSLVSAQNRERLYWTNIKDIRQPKDKQIFLKDILEWDTYKGPGNYHNEPLKKGTIVGRRINEQGKREDLNKNIPIIQCLEVRDKNTDKSNCLTTVEKDNVLTPLPFGRHLGVYEKKLPYRYYTLKEYLRLQTLPDNYITGVSEYKAKKLIGNAWTIDMISHCFLSIK